MSRRVFKELFEDATEIVGRRYPTEAAALESLSTFRNALHESTPVDGVMKRLFTDATVREEVGAGGLKKTFKISLRPAAAGEESMSAVVRGLRAGDLDSVARALDIAPTKIGSRAFRENYTGYVRDVFPDVRVAEQLATAEKALPPRLAASSRALRPRDADELLQAIRRDEELHRLVSNLAEHIRRNGGSQFKYASTFFALAGVSGTVAAVASALHEQAKRSAGCWRLFLDPITRELRGCKIPQASCLNRDANRDAVCDRTPISFKADMCRGVDAECVGCDPTADPQSREYISPSQYLTPEDMYVCRPVASVGEMLGKVVADVPDLAREVVVDVTGTISRAWDSVKYFLLAAGGIVIMILFIYVRINIKTTDFDEKDITYGERRMSDSKRAYVPPATGKAVGL